MSNFINFIDPSTHVKQQALKKWMYTTKTIVKSICCCTTFALCYYLMSIITIVYRSRLHIDQTHLIQEISHVLDTLQTTITTLKDSLHTVHNLLEKPSVSTSALTYITQIIPDNVALQECTLNTKNWIIKGRAKSSPSLKTFITKLKTQEYFKAATLTSLQITHDDHGALIFAFTCEGSIDKRAAI